jgi:hypothetical protein
LAHQFEDPDRILEFLHACDVAQAVLVDCLFKERRFYCIQNYLYAKGIPSESTSPSAVSIAWDEYHKASEEFIRARGKLKDLIAHLDLGRPEDRGDDMIHASNDLYEKQS